MKHWCPCYAPPLASLHTRHARLQQRPQSFCSAERRTPQVIRVLSIILCAELRARLRPRRREKKIIIINNGKNAWREKSGELSGAEPVPITYLLPNIHPFIHCFLPSFPVNKRKHQQVLHPPLSFPLPPLPNCFTLSSLAATLPLFSYCSQPGILPHLDNCELCLK